MKIKIATILVFSIFMISGLCGKTAQWSEEYHLSPSIKYRSRLERERNYHQRAHHVRIDLGSEDVSLEVAQSEEFPRNPELPSVIMNRRKARVAVPASLIRKSANNRNPVLGNLRTSSEIFTLGHAYPETRLKSLNHIAFDKRGDADEDAPVFKTERGETIRITGMNASPREPGLYLFTRSFGYLTREEIERWGVGRIWTLARTTGTPDSNVYWVDKIIDEGRTIDILQNGFLLASAGERAQPNPSLDRRDRLDLVIPDEIPGGGIQGRFCGGPYFIHKGQYLEESVRDFCGKEGSPPLSHYETPQARLALAKPKSGRFLDIYCVDQKGVDYHGMTLSEFAEFLILEGVEEAIALPDGDAASLIIGDRRINATLTGMETPVYTALVIKERSPEPGEIVNLLRRVPNRITAGGSGTRNPITAIKDGSIELVSTLDNYWEHITEDSFHKHEILIDLYKPYKVVALELFYAEEAGFSSQFNWRDFTIATGTADKYELKEIMRVKNPSGYSRQYVPILKDAGFRFLSLKIEKPAEFEESRTARLAELAIWGMAK